MPTLEELLASPEFQGRYAALRLMEKTPNPSHIAPLRRMLHDPESGLRKGAALLLATLKAVEAVPEIVAMLQDPWHGCRIGAARALTQMEPGKHLPLILPLLRDPNTRVKAEAMDCVMASKDPEQAEHLLPLLSIAEDHLHGRAAAGICELAGGRFIPQILPLLQGTDEQEVSQIIRLIRDYASDEVDQALLPLTKSPKQRIRVESTLTLAPRHPDLYDHLLIDWLEEGETKGLMFVDLVSALRHLAAMQRTEAADAMSKYLDHERDDVAGWAALSLARIHSAKHASSVREFTRSKAGERKAAGAIATLRLERIPVQHQLQLLENVEAWQQRNSFGCVRNGAELMLHTELVDALLDAHAPAVYRKLCEIRTLQRDVQTVEDLIREVEAAGIVWTRDNGINPCRGKGLKGRKTSLLQVLEDLECGRVFVPRGSGVALIDFKDVLGWWRSKLHSEKAP